MNVEVEALGFKVKLEYADKKQVDRLIVAMAKYAEGGSFTDHYDVAQSYVQMENKPPSKRRVTEEVDGVKHFPDGKVKYKCSYNCSSCNNKGVRWIEGSEDSVHCHNCNESLIVGPSTLNDAHDEDFNYFIAY